jgi:hypothetical protein
VIIIIAMVSMKQPVTRTIIFTLARTIGGGTFRPRIVAATNRTKSVALTIAETKVNRARALNPR